MGKPKQKQTKQSPLEAVLAAVQKGYGKDAALRLGAGARSTVSEVIPFGIGAVDQYVCGCGGLPVGRLTELFSEEGGGKSSLTLAALAQTQREGGMALLVESEHGLDPDRAKVLGVNANQLGLLQPDHMDEALEQMEMALNNVPSNVGPNLLAWDSIAATPTKGEFVDGIEGEAAIGERARALAKACRVLIPLAEKKRTALLFVNQTREKVGIVFGDKTTTPGGKAVKFHASLRIQLFGGKSIKDGVQHTGKIITVVAVKTRFSPPYRKVRLRLDYATGFNDDWTTLNHAKTLSVVPKSIKGAEAQQAALKRAREHFEDFGWNIGGKNTDEDQLADAKDRLSGDFDEDGDE